MYSKKYITALLVVVLVFVLNTSLTVFAKKSNKKKGPSTACLTCLNYFSPSKLAFTQDPKKCGRILAKCDKTNRTHMCETIINECIEANCKAEGSCSDEKANRGLLYGCLKSENIFLPYQCRSYISGKASAYATEIQNKIKAEEDARNTEAEKAKADAEAAKARADAAAAEAATKQKQMEEETKRQEAELERKTKLELEEKKFQMEQKAKDADLLREQRLKQEAQNSKPNVKYASLFNSVKKSVANAKNIMSNVFNLLGIVETKRGQEQGNIMFFPPQVITTVSLDQSLVNEDGENIAYDRLKKGRVKSYLNGHKYQYSKRWVCTKDTKESFVKTELEKAFDIIKKASDNLATGIGEIEERSADDENPQTISEEKVEKLYDMQTNLSTLLTSMDSKIKNLRTSCETRCKGMSVAKQNKKVEFDDKGNIIENKNDGSGYSCPEIENDNSSSIDPMSMFGGGGMNMADAFGGIGKKVSDLTKRVSEAVIETEYALNLSEYELFISSKYDRSSSNMKYNAILNCAGSIGNNYVSCLKDQLISQYQEFIKGLFSAEELQKNIQNLIATLRQPTYNYIHGYNISCFVNNNNDIESKQINGNDLVNIADNKDPNKKQSYFNSCLSSLNSIVGEIVNRNQNGNTQTLSSSSLTHISISGKYGNEYNIGGTYLTSTKILDLLNSRYPGSFNKCNVNETKNNNYIEYNLVCTCNNGKSIDVNDIRTDPCNRSLW